VAYEPVVYESLAEQLAAASHEPVLDRGFDRSGTRNHVVAMYRNPRKPLLPHGLWYRGRTADRPFCTADLFRMLTGRKPVPRFERPVFINDPWIEYSSRHSTRVVVLHQCISASLAIRLISGLRRQEVEPWGLQQGGQRHTDSACLVATVQRAESIKRRTYRPGGKGVLC
jgi:hypothetical protein